jgi:hypothetical protein
MFSVRRGGWKAPEHPSICSSQPLCALPTGRAGFVRRLLPYKITVLVAIIRE